VDWRKQPNANDGEDKAKPTAEIPEGKLRGEIQVRIGQMETPLARGEQRVVDVQLLLNENRELRERLQASEARFTLAFTQAPIGMVLLTPEGRITETNQAFQRMLGYTAEELRLGDSRLFTHPDDVLLTRNLFIQLSDGAQSTASIEKRYFRKSGEMLWGRASATVQRDDEGRPAHVVAIVEDITERKRVETRYRFLAESIPQMVWTATPDGGLDYVNSQGVAYFGVPQELLLADGWLGFIHPEDRDGTVAAWKLALETGKLYETEFRLKRGSDGSWRGHLVRAQPLLGENGSVAHWFGTCTDIENQKQTDAVLRQQWHTFDTVLSHSLDFTYVFDRRGRLTYVNRALLAFWQKSFEDALGKNFFQLGYPPELAERLQTQIQQVIDTGLPVRDQTAFTGQSGETGYYDYIFVPIFDARNHVEAVAGTTRDITEQNLVKQQIEEDRKRWRDLFLQTPAAIAIIRGPQHQFEWVNPDYELLVGRSAEFLIGKTVPEAVPEAEKQIYISLLDSVYQTGKPFRGHESPIRLDRGDGVLRDLYLNFVYLPTRGSDGEIDGIFVHVTDVTEMVQARKHIEDSERQFRTLAETIPHLAWMADEKGNRLWYNRRWYDYTGTTFEQVKDWGWERVHDPARLPEVLAGWKKALECGKPFEMTVPLKDADGRFRSFLTRVEPVKDHEGNVVRWFGTNTDITAQQETEEELRRINRELEEFSYVASHDLQEPLRTVNIYAQLLTRRFAKGEAEAIRYAEMIGQGTRRMEVLIRDLLSFSRAVHGEELPVGTADLQESWSEALAVLKERVEEAGGIVSATALPRTHGDTAQISHVFQNLLSNALKYRRSGVSPEIRVSAFRKTDSWTIAMQDNGIGFEPMYAERIFGLFKRLHKNEYPGTGLGLAICKRIVERYGGRMWAEGKVGSGATIYFSLPAAEEDKGL
jgi:PAS domain S-box-containing protein